MSVWARVGQREPESELQGLKVSLRVTLGPNLVCQGRPRQSELENIYFPYVFLRFMLELSISHMFLRVIVTKYRKLHAYLSAREGGQSRGSLH